MAAALDPKEMKGVVGVANEDAIQSKSDRLLHVNGAAVNELTSSAFKRKKVGICKWSISSAVFSLV